MTEKTITITVYEDLDDSISDILCWLQGYLAGATDGYDNLLSPSIEKVRKLNLRLKEELKKLEIGKEGE